MLKKSLAALGCAMALTQMTGCMQATRPKTADSVLEERLRTAQVTEQRLNNGALIRNYQFAGSLAPNAEIGCVELGGLSNAMNPPALVFAAKKCVQTGQHLRAWELLSTGTGFAYYDLKRLADRSTQGALSVLLMNAFADLSDAQRNEASNVFKTFQADAAKVDAYCSRLKKMGPPTYDPQWAIRHGIGAYQEPRKGDYLLNVDVEALWAEVLKNRCTVKTG